MITRPSHNLRRIGRSCGALVLLVVLVVTGGPTPAQANTGLTRYAWSANLGLIANHSPWVRNVTYAMTPSTATSGRITGRFVQYDHEDAPAKARIGYAGPCNGVERCTIYTATSTYSGTWQGGYTFDGTDNTGRLSITWDSGMTETWDLTQLRGGTLGQMILVAANWVGVDPNGGIGFGSKQPFSYYKTMGMVDSVSDLYYGSYDRIVNGQTAEFDVPWNLNVGAMNGSSTYPKGLYLLQSPNTSYPACRDDLEYIKGTIYTMWVTNAGRLMSQNNWRRCLVQAETGEYHGGMHVAMLNQVIDDSKNLVGVVGIEASPSGGWTLARIHALKQ
ncbi:hypothetical protein [Microlunatus parietis]|uniref:Uncharacterized protein n=1 Tax=Microlunatus parietis TaxID=682979 RepID=A0A7Y9LF56_9ACTN|nr:hypothetical protein [Microlunatus parietis]NYE74518.1 hypothetical protein [Microlunatus parietis]